MVNSYEDMMGTSEDVSDQKFTSSDPVHMAGDVTPTSLYFKTITQANTQKRMNDEAEDKPKGPAAKVIPIR